MNKILTVIFFLLFALGCKDFHPFDRSYVFWVENKSDKEIVFVVGFNYPDTIIPDNYSIKGVPIGKKTSYESKQKWEDVFEKLPADTLSVFIFSGDVVSNYNWETIRNEYKILRRYDISLDYLNANKGTITYP